MIGPMPRFGALVLASANRHQVPLDLWGGGLPNEGWDTDKRKGNDAEIMTALKAQGFWWPGDSR